MVYIYNSNPYRWVVVMLGLGLGLGLGKLPGMCGSAAFTPLSIPGLQLWLAADDGLVTDGAAQFTAANLEYLSIAHNVSQVFTTALSMSAWVYPDEPLNVGWYISSKWLLGTDGVFGLKKESNSKLVVYILDSPTDMGNNSGEGNTLFNTSSWYHVAFVYDGTGATNADRLKMYVNGIAQAIVFTGTIPSSLQDGDGAPFLLGRLGGTGIYADGRIDSAGIWGRVLSGSDITALFNSSMGKVYSDLTTAQKVSLVSWWNLNEISGQRNDSHGTNHLTDNNTVTYAAGVASGAASSDGDPISQWTDLSGEDNHCVQAIGSKRPTLKLAIQNGLPVVRFDGVDDDLAHLLDIPGANTVFAVVKMIGTTGEQIVISASSGGNLAAYIRGRSGSENWGTYRQADVFANTPISGSFKQVTIVSRSGTDLDLVTDGNVETKVAAGYHVDAAIRRRIGSGQATNWFGGDIAEILLYDSALSAVNRQAVEAYLRTKWATP